MIIGGFEKLSLCDYPGTPAAVIFTQGCNWRCSYCHNHSLLPINTEGKYEENFILMQLANRSTLIDGVVLTGGEPTLQNDLIHFIKQLKVLGLKVKLDTNGSNPAIVEEILTDNLVDYIAMDIKAPWVKYHEITDCSVDIKSLKTTIDLLSKSRIEHHYRTTFSPTLLTTHDMNTIKGELPKKALHVVQNCKET